MMTRIASLTAELIMILVPRWISLMNYKSLQSQIKSHRKLLLVHRMSPSAMAWRPLCGRYEGVCQFSRSA